MSAHHTIWRRHRDADDLQRDRDIPKMFAGSAPAGTGKRVMTQALVSITVPLTAPTGTLTTVMCETIPHVDVHTGHTAFSLHLPFSRNVDDITRI